LYDRPFNINETDETATEDPDRFTLFRVGAVSGSACRRLSCRRWLDRGSLRSLEASAAGVAAAAHDTAALYHRSSAPMSA
jgi:hypothetical protein